MDRDDEPDFMPPWSDLDVFGAFLAGVGTTIAVAAFVWLATR